MYWFKISEIINIYISYSYKKIKNPNFDYLLPMPLNLHLLKGGGGYLFRERTFPHCIPFSSLLRQPFWF